MAPLYEQMELVRAARARRSGSSTDSAAGNDPGDAPDNDVGDDDMVQAEP